MTYQGHVRGGVVVLDEPASLPEGASVRIEIEESARVDASDRPGSAQAILRAIRKPPHLTKEDVDALEEAIDSAKTPCNFKGIFDEDESR